MHRICFALVLIAQIAGCGSNGGEDSGEPGNSASGGAEEDQEESQTPSGIRCAPGYTCSDDPDGDADVVWVMKDDGNVNGPNCQKVCENALPNNCAYHACDEGRELAYSDIDSFQPLAEGLGFECRSGGCWWPEAPGEGMYMVSIGTDEAGTKSCFFPSEPSLSCANDPGNANCYGERYALVCPCVTKPLDEACTWECGPHDSTRATWDTEGTSCLERINYWRARACEEGWVECPAAGLPPMTECTACHECVNSESEYDKDNGAHSSFKRCGESAQGQGGGGTCADVIDAFVSERAPDEDGIMRCEGHCGPILAPGCRSFSWGKDLDSGFHTLNWGGCNQEKCDAYCDEHPDECFTHETSPSLECRDPDENAEANPVPMSCE